MKQHNASRGAKCRHPVRRRHGAFLAMYEAQATKQLSSAIVISSSRFALLFLGASSLSKTPAAAAVDHAAAAITPTERQGSVWVCAENTATVIARGGHRGTVRHAPAHTEQRTYSAVQIHSCRALCKYSYVCGCLLEKLQRGGAQGGTSAQQEAQLDGSDACGTATTSTITHGGSTHTSTKKRRTKKKANNTAAGCGCVCVALRVSARPDRKKIKTRGKEMCAPPHRPSSHAHTSRLPQRAVRRGPSSCVQQARRTGPSS
ncbi:hypothetical protein ECC02_009049 [Trypanosoma cruzi]|uniref:Uncharacterized protein n=1 Tax=Trypanosoma cruzi TaxID=5693 RepID=A0A7J6XUA3_TRYCR|nr:hypothetical protein ECC02_009049 [Trypanosoma cruzi]